MNFFCFPKGPFATNMYIVWCEKTKKAIVIDPGEDALGSFDKVILEHNLEPVAIWLTHSHWDHTYGIPEIQRKYSLPIYIHEEDKKNLEEPGSDGVPIAVPGIEQASADHLIKDGEILKVGELSFKVIHTPGHSPGGVCFYNESEKVLFSGDTIYKGLIGAVCLPTGEPERMWQSLEKLSKLPGETAVYPGHGPSTTIKDEAWISDAKKSGIIHTY